MIEKVLIANRGEIALRVMKTCKALGIKTVAVYSDEDTNSLHVKTADESYYIGEAAPAKSYLNQEKILEVMLSSGTDAIHPGYGFLSENSEFSKILEDNKIKFIGPKSKHIGLMGNKIDAKKVMDDAIRKAISKKRRIDSFVSKNDFIDIGTKETYEKINKNYKKNNKKK